MDNTDKMTSFHYCWSRALAVDKLTHVQLDQLHIREKKLQENEKYAGYYLAYYEIQDWFKFDKHTQRERTQEEIHTLNSFIGRIKWDLNKEIDRNDFTDSGVRHLIDFEVKRLGLPLNWIEDTPNKSKIPY